MALISASRQSEASGIGLPPKTPIGEGVAINDGVRLLAVGAIMAVAAWATDSIAWGLVLGLGVAILYGVLQYRQFLRWSERPLTRPGTPDRGWRVAAYRS